MLVLSAGCYNKVILKRMRGEIEVARTTEISDQHIISVAKKLFYERGITGTEMKDIAQQAGIGRSSLYRHFESKEAIAFHIAREVMELRLSLLMENVDQGETGLELVSRCLDRVVKALIGDIPSVRFLDEFDMIFTKSYPEIEATVMYVTFIKGGRSCLYKYLTQGIADGSIRGELDPEFTEKLLLNNLIGVAQRVLPREAHILEEQEVLGRELLLASVRLLVNGLKA